MSVDELKDFFIQVVKVVLDSGDIFGESGKGFMHFNLAKQRSHIEKILHNLEKACKNL